MQAEWTVFMDWPMLEDTFYVDCGKPLNASNFKDCIVGVIWGSKDDYMIGAVIKFARSSLAGSFGFYTHIGAGQTYTSSKETSDQDFYRGFAGAAQAIYSAGFRFASEETIKDAEAAIGKAEMEGRIKGLDEAIKLLNDARQWYCLLYTSSEPTRPY